MKKTISLILALTLVLGMATTAFAADITPTGGDNHNVTANYVAGKDGGTIYGVDISWGDMVFTYTDASKGTWNAAEHKYENGTEAKWTCGDNQNIITVTNHSNAPIDVTPSYTAETAYSTAEVKFDKTTLNLGTADNGEGDNGAGKATKGTITVTVSGTLTKDDKTTATTGTTIGQITLTLKDASK